MKNYRYRILYDPLGTAETMESSLNDYGKRGYRCFNVHITETGAVMLYLEQEYDEE